MAPGLLVDQHPLITEDAFKIAENPSLHELFLAGQPNKTQPDIDWVPDYKKYIDRTRYRIKIETLTQSLPADWPRLVHEAQNWSGAKDRSADIFHTLNNDEVLEIEAALQHFKSLDLSKNDISPETFPLPQLAQRLDTISQDVHNGNGVAILRGIEPSRYSFEDNIVLYAGVAAHIGERRAVQDRDGNVIVHIKDSRSHKGTDGQRQSPYSNNAQPFHTDIGDILAMYMFDRAKTGGESKLSSVAKVYNEIAATRPDLIQTLMADDWPFDNHTIPPSSYVRPILYHDSERQRVSMCFSRRQLTGSTAAPRPAGLPALTEAQAEALDAVHFTAAKHAMTLQLARGDMQFVNNTAVLHAREAFQDGVDESNRHAIRMWLRNERYAAPTPPQLQKRWNEAYDGSIEPTWHMSPEHPRAHIISCSRSCFA